jgi:two-component system, NarL family, nitrate/nitrite response regulator NarL
VTSVPIAIVEDHPVFRQGLAAVLRSRGFDAVHTFSGAEPTEDIVGVGREGSWVAILDVRLAVGDGISLCRMLRASQHPPVVIMLSTFDEPAIVQAARDAGAYAYLSKEAEPATIVDLVRSGLERGGTIIAKRLVPSLSYREQAVLNCLGEGMSNKRIARELNIGVETVKDHLQRLFEKLDVGDRLNAVKRARELGVLDP